MTIENNLVTQQNSSSIQGFLAPATSFCAKQKTVTSLVAISVLLLVAAFFLALAAFQILPPWANSISKLGGIVRFIPAIVAMTSGALLLFIADGILMYNREMSTTPQIQTEIPAGVKTEIQTGTLEPVKQEIKDSPVQTPN